MKKGILGVWLIFAIIAFVGGLGMMISMPAVSTYFGWGAVCAVVCIFHLIYDYVSKTRDGILLYIILSVVLGPIILAMFIYHAVVEICSGRGTKKRQASGNNSQNTKSSKDTRSTDYGLSAIKKAADRGIERARCGVEFRYGHINGYWKTSKSVSRLTGISVTGEIEFRVIGDGEGSAIMDNIVECMNSINQSVVDCIIEELEKVQQEYQGYDDDWKVSSDIKPRVSL